MYTPLTNPTCYDSAAMIFNVVLHTPHQPYLLYTAVMIFPVSFTPTGEGGVRGQGGGTDHRVQSRLPVRAVLPRQQDPRHARAASGGLKSPDRGNHPEGHAGTD